MGEGERGEVERGGERGRGEGKRLGIEERQGVGWQEATLTLFPSFFRETLIKVLQCEMRDFPGRMEWATSGKVLIDS